MGMGVGMPVSKQPHCIVRKRVRVRARVRDRELGLGMQVSNQPHCIVRKRGTSANLRAL
jgi:hypothetical protein